MAETDRHATERTESRIIELEEQLARARSELDALTYAVSHDLRAPLRTVFGFTQLLARKFRDRLEGQGLEYLDRIGSGSIRMERMIEDLLKLSRVGRADLHREETDASLLVQDVIGELRNSDPERNVEVRVEAGMRINADPQQLRVLFLHLLDNAWKFTRRVPAARIEVSARELGGVTFWCVSDNGAGFPKNQADRLFKPFQRLHLENEFPGTGMGLAIVRKIVERHAGTVMADGEEGNGATFCFSVGKPRA